MKTYVISVSRWLLAVVVLAAARAFLWLWRVGAAPAAARGLLTAVAPLPEQHRLSARRRQ